MKIITSLIMAALGLGAGITFAQDAPASGPSGPGPRGPRPVPPIIAALDKNSDGKIDASEIANASSALKALDKNGDGELTTDELGGLRPGGERRGPGGVPGRRPPPPEQ